MIISAMAEKYGISKNVRFLLGHPVYILQAKTVCCYQPLCMPCVLSKSNIMSSVSDVLFTGVVDAFGREVDVV